MDSKKMSHFMHSVWFKRFAFLLVLFVAFSWASPGDGISAPDSYEYDYDDYGYETLSVTDAMDEGGFYDYAETEARVANSDTFTYQDDGVTIDPKVIKTGSLNMNVKNTDDTVASVTSIAAAYGGFVQSSSTWVQSDETTVASMTIRVESSQFEQALADIESLATLVTSESISGEDVTEEYVDMQSRLGNLEALEEQYLDVLNSAVNVEEILMVHDSLSEVREDIEVIQGRLNYIDNSADYSTISLSIYEEASILAPTSDWQPVVVAKEAFNKLIVTLQGFVDALIEFLIYGVPLLILLLIVYRIGRWGYERFGRRRRE